MTLLMKQLAATIADIDPGLTPTANGYSEAAIMLASVSVGADEELIAAALDFEDAFVRSVGARLRTAGIWNSTGRIADDRIAEWSSDSGGVAFSMDLAVASGDMEVAGFNGGERSYRMTKQGRSRVEGLLKATPA